MLFRSTPLNRNPNLSPCRSTGIAETFFPLLISVLQPSIQTYFPFFSLAFKTANASATVIFLFPQHNPGSLNNLFAFFSQRRDEPYSPHSHSKIAGESGNKHSTSSSETWMWSPTYTHITRMQVGYKQHIYIAISLLLYRQAGVKMLENTTED